MTNPVGRPAITPGERSEAHTVSLPRALWEWLSGVGDGNLSRGIRRICAWAHSRPEPARTGGEKKT